MKRWSTTTRKTAGAIISVSVAALVLVAAVIISRQNRPYGFSQDDISDCLQGHFIDVGQGDAALVVVPDGGAMLIDAGPPEAAEALEVYIRDLGIDSIDCLVISHLHADHYGGAVALADVIDISRVIVSEAKPDTGTGRDLYNTLMQNGCEISTVTMGDEFLLGEARVQVLYPYAIVENGENNDSLIIKLIYKDTTFLFTGDTEDISEQALLGLYGDTLSSDVLKVAHHGSSSSSTEDFISAVSPSVAVISCEKNNAYGHPHIETLHTLSAHGVKVLRTDLSGTVVILSDGENIFRYTGSVKKRNTLY